MVKFGSGTIGFHRGPCCSSWEEYGVTVVASPREDNIPLAPSKFRQ